MKLGSKVGTPLDDLDDIILPGLQEYQTDADALPRESKPLSEEECSVFWEDVRKEVSSRKQVHGAAHMNRIERELVERFGAFKNILTHPYSRLVARCLGTIMRTRFVSDPILPTHTCIVLLFMAYQGKMPTRRLFLLACFLFAVHPLLVVLGLILLQNVYRQKYELQGPTHRLRDECLVDVLIYGGGLKGLYAGALLVRAGCRVIVLVPHTKCDGGSTVCPEGSPCEFVLDRCEIGQIARYEALLLPCLHPSKPIVFEPVGSAQAGWAHGVVVAGDINHPIPLRSGAQAWADDLSRALGAERCCLVALLQQAAAVFLDMFPFVSARLPKDASLLRFHTLTDHKNTMATFEVASSMTFSEAARQITSAARQTPMPHAFKWACATICLLREEYVLPEQVSFAAWSTSIIHGIDGYHVPKGGISLLCASLETTIKSCGGEVRTSTIIHDVETICDHEKSVLVTTSIGPERTSGTYLAQKVLFAVDAFDCFRILKAANMPIQDIQRSRLFPSRRPGSFDSVLPILRTLIAFKGTCKDLDVPQAVPTFLRKGCNPTNLGTFDGLDWKTITFHDAPKAIVACVVEGPVASCWKGTMGQDSSGQPREPYFKDILHRLAYFFPKTEGKVIHISTLGPTPRDFSCFKARHLETTIHNLDNIFFAQDDLALSKAAGSVIAAYVAAHAVLGYRRRDLSRLRDILAP